MPLPTYRLANAALRSLRVDAEISPYVKRSFALERPESGNFSNGETVNGSAISRQGAERAPSSSLDIEDVQGDGSLTVLRTDYRATTNRMLRVAVNGFMESLGLVLDVMGGLDVDVLSVTD